MAKVIDRPYDTVWPILVINARDLFVLDGPLGIVTKDPTQYFGHADKNNATIGLIGVTIMGSRVSDEASRMICFVASRVRRYGNRCQIGSTSFIMYPH